jgi:hypothetical protein
VNFPRLFQGFLYFAAHSKLITAKKTILFSALFLCLFASCKKSNSNSSNSNYHFTATVDGKAQTFNVSPLATQLTAYGVTTVAIEGFTGTGTATQAFILGVTSDLASSFTFHTGAYSDTTVGYSLTGSFTTSGAQAYASGTSVTGEASSAGVSVNHLKITITSLDSTAVKGTFSGDFFFEGDLTGTKQTITNGDFFVPWKK